MVKWDLSRSIINAECISLVFEEVLYFILEVLNDHQSLKMNKNSPKQSFKKTFVVKHKTRNLLGTTNYLFYLFF